MNNLQKMLDLPGPAEDGHTVCKIETHDHQSHSLITVGRLVLHVDNVQSYYHADYMSHFVLNGGIRQQPNLWFCCHCSYTNNCALAERCVGCEHPICSECQKQQS